jgi:glutaredoxin-related protein
MGEARFLISKKKEKLMADDIINKIDEKVKNNKVMLYMKGTPDFPAVWFFGAHGRDPQSPMAFHFATEDVLADPSVRDGIKRIFELADDPADLYRRQVRRGL